MRLRIEIFEGENLLKRAIPPQASLSTKKGFSLLKNEGKRYFIRKKGSKN